MSSPHYCIWGLCESQQYCCGDNVCCYETDINFSYSAAIIFGSVAVSAIIYICYYFMYREICAFVIKKYCKITFTSMSNQRKNETNAARNQESIVGGCVVQIEKKEIML